MLALELSNRDESLRDRAVLGLRQLDSKQARTALWERGFSS